MTLPPNETFPAGPVLDAQGRAAFTRALEGAAAHLNLALPPGASDAFLVHAERLLHTNRHTNLTRITAPAEVAVKHFADSLSVLVACSDLAPGARMADIGTGAGFPGLPLKIVRPDLFLTLVDALGKRLKFLAGVVDELHLAHVSLVHARAEDAGRDPACRERFDLVVARAVAALPTLLEWCAPLARVGGRFVAMKSGDVDDELAASANAAHLLGLRLMRDVSLTLPPAGDDAAPSGRRLLVWEKQRPTPARFPRRPAEIKAKPL